MTKLHEILAVEADAEGIKKRMIDETNTIFKSKHHLFIGHNKKLSMDGDGHDAIEKASSELTEVSTTVGDRLDYTCTAIANWLNVVSIKEHTNQTNAKADLVVEGVTLAKNIPATYLLGLETKLKEIRNMYLLIPTLPSNYRWNADETRTGIYHIDTPEIKNKTKKVPKSRILYEATKEHRAEIEKWVEEAIVGTYTTVISSGMVTSARKSTILGRIDTLVQAVKQARQRANNVDVIEGVNIGTVLFKYINQ